MSKNPVNSFAVDQGYGKLMVIRPGTEMSDSVLDDLDALGTVVDLVSPGALHNMGFPHWKERYSDARLFATKSGIPHIAKALKVIKVNRRAYAIFLQELIVKHGVTDLAPCHGAVLGDADTSARIGAILEAAM